MFEGVTPRFGWQRASNAYLIQRGNELVSFTGDDGLRETSVVSGPPMYQCLFQRFVAERFRRWREGLPAQARLRDCLRATRLVDALYAAAGGHDHQGGKAG